MQCQNKSSGVEMLLFNRIKNNCFRESWRIPCHILSNAMAKKRRESVSHAIRLDKRYKISSLGVFGVRPIPLAIGVFFTRPPNVLSFVHEVCVSIQVNCVFAV